MASKEINDELKKILTEHETWMRTVYKEGKCANLVRSSLADIDFGGANLEEANFSDSNLMRAFFYNANLSSANLKKVNLESSNLTFANLSNANLNGANLRNSVLISTNFCDSNLEGADLFNTVLIETVFANVDLSKTINLDKCEFHGPCIIDFRTLEKSKNLPLSFLRGCGLPERVIENLPGLIGDAIEYYSCFISYSTKDQEFAERLYADLQNKGVRCWFAPEDLKMGDKFRVEIDQKIRLHDKLLLILSENSINSAWVEKEVETAFEKEQETGELVLFPIRLYDDVMETKAGWAADIRRSRHIGDFTKWKDHDSYQKAFERLLRDLKGEE